MPAYVQSSGGLIISFYRNDEIHEQQTADNGVRAVSAAMRILALRAELQPGDRLTVESNGPQDSPPPPAG
jgi:hypothetical protein